jgi:mRNA-degrading endonuclease toxin of MazEF toxin-antitoxin module
VAKKGDILRAKRRIGFLGKGESSFVVLQANALNTALPTIMVAPVARTPPASTPLAVPVSGSGSAAKQGAVALVGLTGPQPRSRFDATPTGAVDAGTLRALERALVLLFDLP